MIVTTDNGTKYRIDLTAKTWERIEKTEKSGPLRTESGVFWGINPIEIGQGIYMTCPPIKEGLLMRAIYTSDVVSVEEE